MSKLPTHINIGHQRGFDSYFITKFFGGSSDENQKLVRNFLRASGAQKKSSQIFRLQWAFFVVVPLKTIKKPLKTDKNG